MCQPSHFLINRLLTPPETPLFHSLDDEEDQRIGMAHRGRTQIKPISISRSSTVSDYLMKVPGIQIYLIDNTCLSSVKL